MGKYAEDIIDRICDSSGDYTRSYKQKRIWIKDEPYEANIRKVRKELAILIKNKIKEFPQHNENLVVGTCRRFINKKYGEGWRERYEMSEWKKLEEYINPEFNWNYELNKHIKK